MISSRQSTISKVLVVGGANVDIKGRSDANLTPHTSNPGRVWKSPGGVGRNIANNLAVEGVPVAFMSAFGEDDEGQWLMSGLEKAGVDTTPSIRLATQKTSTYLAIVDAEGELSVAVSAMRILDELSPNLMANSLRSIHGIGLICVDTNLSSESLTFLCQYAHEQQIPLVCEPVSVTKAARMRDLLPSFYAITPNQDELAALSGMPVSSTDEVALASAKLVRLGARVVVTTCGRNGAVVVTKDGTSHVPALVTVPVDVTGAGDAFTAGFVAGLGRGMDAVSAAGYGTRLAARVVASEHSVLQADED